MRKLSVALLYGFLCVASIPAARAEGVVLQLSAEDQKIIEKKLGGGVVGKALPSEPLADAAAYFPLQERAPSYQVTTGPKAGDTLQLQVAKSRRPNGTPAWRFEVTPSVAAFLRQTSTGDLLMPAMVDTDEGLVIVTTPPNPFLLKGMKPGETRTFSQAVSVNYLDEPADQKYSGKLNSSYTYLGTYRVTVPAGVYDAVLMRHKYAGKVGPADTQDTMYYFFVPGVGVVAMITQEDFEAFWILHVDTSTGKVMAAGG